MMRKFICAAVLAVASITLGGCATIINGSSQPVEFQSEPTGAEIELVTGLKCSTPCQHSMKRGRDSRVTFTKAGYQPVTVYIQSRTGVIVAGNAVVGGIPGVAVDVLSGASNRLYPDPVYIRLVPMGSSDEPVLLDKDGEVISTVDEYNVRVAEDVIGGLAEQGHFVRHPGGSEVPPVTDQPHLLGSGDKIRVVTFGEERFSGEFLVGGDGNITFPLLGRLPIRGRNVAEVEALIIGRLAPDYLRDPRITVEVVGFRPVYVLGEVARPGEYAYVEGLTLTALVARAGGFSYRANKKNVYITPEGEVTERLVEFLNTTPVRPGDTIRVRQRIF
ncbi:MAG: hypothetical protein B7Z33_08215 [Sphingomonadales bacterium 12-68-11]|nr:MAG: hypothetical protein B7Z33_08215 [Sphingomonadales bacterium 12-68-11]